MRRCIGVIGGNQAERDILKLAEQVGEKIAQAGYVLVCGGRFGVMEAACKGAKNADGLTVGILPGDSRCEANSFVDIPIVTGMGIGRNIIVIRSSEAVIAIDGHFGTLSEIAYALQLGIPVIGLKTWDFTKNIQIADSPKAAVFLAEQMLLKKQGRSGNEFN